MKIAVYGIALNEAKHVDRFMDAVRGADLVVITDTGSTDGTPELFRWRGATVHQYKMDEFRFDTARNVALAHVPADVDICVSLDIDEVPDPDFFDKLREAWQPDTGRAWVMWDTGNIWANNLRVHARHGYMWKYPCHEVTYPVSGTENEIVIETKVVHLPDNSKSRGSYLPLLELGHLEMPEDERTLVYLIREYFFHKQWDNVIHYTKLLAKQEATAWDIEMAQSYRFAGEASCVLGDIEQGERFFLDGVRVAPTSLEAWHGLAMHYYNQQKWQECYDAADKVNHLSPESRNHYVADMSITWRMHDLLSIACWYLGKKGSAKKYARLALEGNPEDERLRKNYEFILLSVAKEYKDGL